MTTFGKGADMPTISETRRDNLLILLERFRSIAEFNATMGRDRRSPVFALIKSQKGGANGRPRIMGDKLAREIEARLALPEGWMDESHSDSATPDVAIDYLPTETADFVAVPTLSLVGDSRMTKERIHLDRDVFELNFPGEPAENFRAAVVRDATMSPTLVPGDCVLVDVSKNVYSSDGVYCLQTSAGFVLRRVTFKLNGTLVVSADTDPADKTPLDQLEGVAIFGKAVLRWSMSKM